MNEDYVDWETQIREIGHRSQKSSRNSEKAIGAIAEVLENQKILLSKLTNLEKSQVQLREAVAQLCTTM